MNTTMMGIFWAAVGSAAGVFIASWFVVPLVLRDHSRRDGFELGVVGAVLAIAWYALIALAYFTFSGIG
jgi:hypothetical protein